MRFQFDGVAHARRPQVEITLKSAALNVSISLRRMSMAAKAAAV